MFTLRVFNAEGIESNQILGSTYTVLNRETNYEQFADAFEKAFGRPHVADGCETSNEFTKSCYAIVIGIEGSYMRPLYKKQQNYIMTSDGKTYDNVTYK